MEYVITRLCQDCVDGSCLEVCPVECILQHDGEGQPAQLFIDPELCIGCGACEPECPWEAIYDLDDVPTTFFDDIALNRRAAEFPDEYSVPEGLEPGVIPELAQVALNKKKWLEA